MEWQVVLLAMEAGTLLVESYRYAIATVINGFVCWVHTAGGVHPRAQHCDISVFFDGSAAALESVILNVSASSDQGWGVMCRQCTAMHDFCLALGSRR
jgi:hypothetical protein